jgi:antitoxin ParD1/3/4
MNVSLPPSLKNWVEKQVDSGGYGTASEFIRDMLRKARVQEVQTRVDKMLLEAIDSETVEMNDKDWTEIRATARSHAKQVRRQKSK